MKNYYKKEGLEHKADLNYTLNSSKFSGILKDVQVPLITKNGSITVIQEIDFTTGINTITNHIYETKMILESLQKFGKKVECEVEKVHIAFEEPAIKTEQHQIFNQAYIEYKKDFNFIHPQEVDKITDDILSSPLYKKFQS